MGEVGDASNFKKKKKEGAVGLQFAHAVFLFLGRFAWNDLFSRDDQQPIKLCIAQIHVGRLLPGFVRLNHQRL
jgi:hypothetical protein